MNETLEGQVSLFGPDTAFGKTSAEPSAPTEAKISKPSSRSSSKSATRTPLMCLCLTSGPKVGCSTPMWVDGLLPIGCMTLNSGAFHSDADGFVSLPISTGLPLGNYCLTLNCGEKPRIPNPTKLSQILQEDPDERYRLSAKACQGILNRANRRGKQLPEELDRALREQILA